MTQQLPSLVQIVGGYHRVAFLVSRRQAAATRGRYSKVILAELGCSLPVHSTSALPPHVACTSLAMEYV